jgi:hypothetical protein
VQYCKQLDPSWEQIANLVTAKSTHVSVGKFNCEVPAENAAICKQLGVDRYPSIFYIGYGSLNQAPAGNPFGTSTIPRLVHFTAALYPEAIYDWVRMLGGVSFWQRRWDDFLGVFTGRSRAARQVEALETANVALDRKVRIFSAELEKYKAKELFDSVPDNGDPFPMLAGLQPGPENLPLRMCVIDLASEYCKYVDHTEEPWCANVRPCKDDKMVSQQCRPVSCPFNHARGCNLVSSCSKSEIVSEYQKALSNADL